MTTQLLRTKLTIPPLRPQLVLRHHLVERLMALNLSEEAVAALETRTEGWIAGLQVAGLSMRGRTGQELAQFINFFTGSHRYLMDFLAEEVLERQSASIQEFLLQTSILARLSGSLCNAVVALNE